MVPYGRPPHLAPPHPHPQLFSPSPLASTRRISHTLYVRLPAPGALKPRSLSSPKNTRAPRCATTERPEGTNFSGRTAQKVRSWPLCGAPWRPAGPRRGTGGTTLGRSSSRGASPALAGLAGSDGRHHPIQSAISYHPGAPTPSLGAGANLSPRTRSPSDPTARPSLRPAHAPALHPRRLRAPSTPRPHHRAVGCGARRRRPLG